MDRRLSPEVRVLAWLGANNAVLRRIDQQQREAKQRLAENLGRYTARIGGQR